MIFWPDPMHFLVQPSQRRNSLLLCIFFAVLPPAPGGQEILHRASTRGPLPRESRPATLPLRPVVRLEMAPSFSSAEKFRAAARPIQ